MPAFRRIECECGFVARECDPAELVRVAQAHARGVHQMEFSPEQLLALSVEDGEHDAERPLASSTPEDLT